MSATDRIPAFVPEGIQYGECWCGCGGKTPIAKQTDSKYFAVKGEPRRYVVGHANRGKTTAVPPNPSGLCECGCGNPAPISPYTSAANGYVKGYARRFIKEHRPGRRTLPNRWVEEERGYETPCWIWQLALNEQGYGVTNYNGHKALAHRALYVERVGAIPDGLVMDHLCRVPACVNPEHVEPVTQAVNIYRGAASKLSVETATEIRASDLPAKALAQRYGVSTNRIREIRKGRAWTEAA